MWPCSSSSSSESMFINLDSAEKEKSVARTMNVEEEYNKALHSKSFIDMWKKAHHQLKRATTTATATATATASPREEEVEECSTPRSPLPLRYYTHLPDFLLDPSQETLLAMAAGDHHSAVDHRLLVEYFTTTLEACNACTALLASIDRARAHRRSLRLLLLHLSATHDASSFSDLASHANLDNPLSTTNLSHFHHTHSLYPLLLRRLTAARRRIAKRARILRAVKKAVRCAIVAACGAAAVAAVVVAMHSVVAIAAVPAAVAAVRRWAKRRVSAGRLETAGKTMDAAAKGAYIVARDLDTVSRMVRRLHDEVEHGRDVVRMVLRNREWQLVREVVREMDGGEVGFREQVAELEEHVYLCLLTINRSRRLVAKEMGGGAPPQAAATGV